MKFPELLAKFVDVAEAWITGRFAVRFLSYMKHPIDSCRKPKQANADRHAGGVGTCVGRRNATGTKSNAQRDRHGNDTAVALQSEDKRAHTGLLKTT